MGNLLLVPASGKYSNVNLGNKTYEIWRTNPRTGTLGTEVEYSVAVDLLSLQPPVVTLVPQVKGGKMELPFTEEDADRIRVAQQTGASQIRQTQVSAQASAQAQPTVRFDSSVVEALNESQARMQEQEAALLALKRENDRLRAQLESSQAQPASDIPPSGMPARAVQADGSVGRQTGALGETSSRTKVVSARGGRAKTTA